MQQLTLLSSQSLCMLLGWLPLVQTTQALLDQLDNIYVQSVGSSNACANILKDSNTGGMDQDVMITM